MGKLVKYSKKLSVMDIILSYQNETIKFNLHDELAIHEDDIDRELRDQPRIYSFLSMLHKKLIKHVSEKEAIKERAYARGYMKARDTTDKTTGRFYAKEDAKYKAELDKLYIKTCNEYNEAKELLGIIETCVRGFEQRSYLLQTISANRRKENG